MSTLSRLKPLCWETSWVTSWLKEPRGGTPTSGSVGQTMRVIKSWADFLHQESCYICGLETDRQKVYHRGINPPRPPSRWGLGGDAPPPLSSVCLASKTCSMEDRRLKYTWLRWATAYLTPLIKMDQTRFDFSVWVQGEAPGTRWLA